jgi:hypothetical protein
MKDQGSHDADPNGNDSAPQPVRENAKSEDRQASQQGDFHQVESHRPDMRSARPVFHPRPLPLLDAAKCRERLSGQLLERPFRLDREADGDFGRAVEYFQDMIAQQAPILAPGPLAGGQFNPAVAGVALGTGDIAFLHPRNMRHQTSVFQSGSGFDATCGAPQAIN